ncbi:MAG TPA: DUF6538 domain-containing protein, partial [Steroidobacteraceae bacterium]|nr:DUF6538 domain-containing protein [Steroidobacteraceae bacterium]
MNTTNLKLRGRTWYARLAIPLSIQEKLGKTELLKSLGTPDLAEANRLKHSVLGEMHKVIGRASTVPSRGPLDVILDAAQELRDSIASGARSHEDAQVVFDSIIESYLDRAERTHGVNAEGHP